MSDNTINENYIYDTRFKDYFYGSDDHYQHPGWYFDKVINSLDDLEGLKNQVYTNRFVLVYEYHAIFMRTNDNNSYYCNIDIFEKRIKEFIRDFNKIK